jgi:hypothetical protein
MVDAELDPLPQLIADAAEPLPDPDDPAFGAMFDRFGDARVVLSAKRATARANSTARGPPSRSG